MLVDASRDSLYAPAASGERVKRKRKRKRKNLLSNVAGRWTRQPKSLIPIDYFATQRPAEPLVFVRGTDAKLRGFYNVCRYRARPAAEARGSRKLSRCGHRG